MHYKMDIWGLLVDDAAAEGIAYALPADHLIALCYSRMREGYEAVYVSHRTGNSTAF